MKYRLFDFSSGEGELLVKGGIERVNDHSAAIEQVQSELKEGGWITSEADLNAVGFKTCLLYTSPSPRDLSTSRMPSSA